LSNLAAQLAEQNALGKIKEVLAEIPRVRKDMGYPPLVTPASQIVGTQATLNILTGERYKVITNETKNYFQGLYGKPPGSLNSKIRKKSLEGDRPILGRPADNLAPELEDAKQELVGKNIAEEDIVSYALLPSVALQFFDERERGELKPEPLHTQSEGVPAGAHDLHLAPVEFKVTVHGESYHIRISGSGQTIDGTKPYYIKVNDKLEEVYLEPIQEVLAGAPDVQTASSSTKVEGRPKPSQAGDVTTPMPGRVIKVLVAQGDKVKTGDPLLVVEAMKMENRVQAPIAGKVGTIYVKEGDEVNPDETLIHLE